MKVREMSVILDRRIILHSGKEIYFVELEKLDFVEACNYYALVHSAGKTIIVRETLSSLEKKLGAFGFLRIHRSVIINRSILTCVTMQEKKMVIQTTIGKEFIVSRHRHKQFREAVLEDVLI